MTAETGRTCAIEVRGDIDPRAVSQLERCAEAGGARAAVLCADGHVGYSQPIGGVVAYADKISPSGVGYDIACGNKAVKTNILAGDVPVAEIMDEIATRISFGVGRVNDEPADHGVLDKIRDADFPGQRGLLDLAAKQLGTVGSGNHYVDLFRDEDGWLWVGCHFGSRGFGHKTATGFLALSQGKAFGDHAAEGEMDSPPVLFDTKSGIGQAYIAAMTLAGEYAYAGRDTVVGRVLEILGAEICDEVHNHHNFAWREQHGGEDLWVVRKGATPAFPGQRGFVGATMGEPSVILRGVESSGSAALLYSTVHGAGRVMSRTQAAGRSRRRWSCMNRDCDWYQAKGEGWEHGSDCPKCGASVEKRWQQISAGEIDWAANLADLAEKGIELRGSAADEAPGAYKRLDAVLSHHAGTIEVEHTLTPIGVAMAGAGVVDPYKD